MENKLVMASFEMVRAQNRVRKKSKLFQKLLLKIHVLITTNIFLSSRFIFVNDKPYTFQ